MPSPARSFLTGGLFLLPLVLLGLAAACGATETPEPVQTLAPGTDGSVTEAPSTTSADAIQLLQSAWDNPQLPESFRVSVDMTMNESGQETTFVTVTEFAGDGRRRSLVSTEDLGESYTVETITTQDEVFTNMPFVGWVRMSLESLASFTGLPTELIGDPMSLANNLILPEGTPWELYDITSVGQEEIDGVLTEHVRIEIKDLEAFAELMQENLDGLANVRYQRRYCYRPSHGFHRV